MLCYKRCLHTRAIVKKVAGAPEVPQFPGANPEAGIRPQDSPSKSREEQEQAQRDIPSCSGVCILGRGHCALVSPHWGPAGSHYIPFLPVREGFRQKKRKDNCVQLSLSSSLGSRVPSTCSLDALRISQKSRQQPRKMFLGLGDCRTELFWVTGTLALLELSLRHLYWPIGKPNVRGRRDFKIIPLEILQHERKAVVCSYLQYSVAAKRIAEGCKTTEQLEVWKSLAQIFKVKKTCKGNWMCYKKQQKEDPCENSSFKEINSVQQKVPTC